MKHVRMSILSALEYSSGSVLVALEGRLTAEQRDAVNLSDWPDVSVRLWDAVRRLPADHPMLLDAQVSFDEHAGKRLSPRQSLENGLNAGMPCLAAVRDYVAEHGTSTEAWDRVRGAVEDATSSLKDLVAAL